MPVNTVDVIVDRKVDALDRPLTYKVPDELGERLVPGVLVRVPLRTGSTLGYVVSVGQPAPPGVRLRSILEVLSEEPLWGSELMHLAEWMRRFYGSTMAGSLQSVVPAPVRIEKRPRRGLARRAEVPMETPVPHPLNPIQSATLHAITDLMDAGKAAVALLHGVTGSGKTEVYLNAIEAMLQRGRQAIVLVPEISLTAQAIDRYQARFGDQVAVMHSQLSPGERLGEWWRIRHNQAAVALGPRSAVFAPQPDPGLIIVDEEHDGSYKQAEQTPRYHARQVAIKRAMERKSVVLLGSATPSLESYHWAQAGRYHYLPMPQRVGGRPMPLVQLVDLRDPRRRRRGLISDVLQERMQAVLQNAGQVLLCLNRRGFSSFLLCKACGHIPSCSNCAITFTFHLQGRRLKCHYCQAEADVPAGCPKCGTDPMAHIGTGTQRVEEELARLFPDVPLVRMDRDTTSTRGSHRDLLAEFASGRARILLGTQMIAKGLDFPGVHLSAVLLADTGLALPDFRASERAFALLTQVAGRAGRGDVAGEVLVQTFNPEHPAIQYACLQDYERFYAWEIEQRRELMYPPFSHFVNVLISGEDESVVVAHAKALGERLVAPLEAAGCTVFGPSPCPIERIKRRHRWHIAVKCRQVGPVVELITPLLEGHQASLDVDPVSLL